MTAGILTCDVGTLASNATQQCASNLHFCRKVQYAGNMANPHGFTVASMPVVKA